MTSLITSASLIGGIEITRSALLLWLRGALILLFALAFYRLAAKATAASRHAILATALGVCLLVPLADSALPTWSIEVPWPTAPTFTVSYRVEGRADAAPPAATRAREEVANWERAVEAGTPGGSSGSSAFGVPAASGVSNGLESQTPVATSVDWYSENRVARVLEIAFWIWGLGFAARWLGRGVAIAARSRQLRSAVPAPEVLVRAMERVRRELGIERPVRLYCSRAVAIPATWGTWRPVVLLPASARRWAPQRLRHVLLHELSHVRRCDALVQHLAWLAVTVHWFDPLAWYLARRLRVEAEKACDDLVLLAGGRPAAYAGHLLEIARATRSYGMSTAVGMARSRSALSDRVESILDEEQVRRSTSRIRPLVAALLVTVLGVSVATATVRPGTPPPTPPQPETVPAAPPAPESASEMETPPAVPAPQDAPTIASAPTIGSASAAPAVPSARAVVQPAPPVAPTLEPTELEPPEPEPTEPELPETESPETWPVEPELPEIEPAGSWPGVPEPRPAVAPVVVETVPEPAAEPSLAPEVDTQWVVVPGPPKER